MAKLSFIEREDFDSLFEMEAGYVLDFRKNKLREFIIELIGIDIYKKYDGLSAAKSVRAILADSSDADAGKMLHGIMCYMENKGMVDSENEQLFQKCALTVERLVGQKVFSKRREQDGGRREECAPFDYDLYLRRLMELQSLENSPQSRGYAFEKYLNDLFADNDLDPKGSFKIAGEQIDGSFMFNNFVHLIEAKWTNQKVDKATLVVFNEKVASKSNFTKGLFISNAGYTEEALSTFSQGRTVRIVLMTIQELVIALERRISFKKILAAKERALDERGDFNRLFSKIYEDFYAVQGNLK